MKLSAISNQRSAAERLNAPPTKLSAISNQQSAISDQQKREEKTQPMKDFHELKVWQKAHRLTLAVYGITAGFPREERYGSTSQLRRCSASIAANLAEGCGRHGDGEFARFCSIAMGSASELEYHLLLAKDLKLIQTQEHAELSQSATEVKRMLTALFQKLNADR